MLLDLACELVVNHALDRWVKALKQALLRVRMALLRARERGMEVNFLALARHHDRRKDARRAITGGRSTPRGMHLQKKIRDRPSLSRGFFAPQCAHPRPLWIVPTLLGSGSKVQRARGGLHHDARRGVVARPRSELELPPPQALTWESGPISVAQAQTSGSEHCKQGALPSPGYPHDEHGVAH